VVRPPSRETVDEKSRRAVDREEQEPDRHDKTDAGLLREDLDAGHDESPGRRVVVAAGLGIEIAPVTEDPRDDLV
jgi:hypothetical protein